MEYLSGCCDETSDSNIDGKPHFGCATKAENEILFTRKPRFYLRK